MMFGRKRTREQAGDPVAEEQAEVDLTGEQPGDAADEDLSETIGDDTDGDDELVDDELVDDELRGGDEVDPRADGPFDIDEVELGGDDVTRIDLGALVITPWQGLNLQLQVNEATRQVRSITGIWHKSGLEVALFAAPASGGLADDLREELVEEAQQAGGSADLADGPFGKEVRRVMPQTGPNGEQLFHVSRIWFAEGPRWLLRGTLLGEAAVADAGDTKAGPFIEFFRNLVVRRGSKPMVPGELITMELPNRNEG